MHANLKGALAQINQSYKSFIHRGKRLSKIEVKKVLEYGINKGYRYTSDFSDEEVDEILNKSEK